MNIYMLLSLNYELFVEINTSQVYCKLFSFSKYFTTTTFAWFQVAASIDRFLQIFYQNTIYRWLKKPHVKWLIFSLTLLYSLFSTLSLLLDASILYHKNGSECTFKNFKTNYYIYVFNASIVPFVIMFAISIAMTIKLMKSRQRTNHYPNQLSTSNQTSSRDVRFCTTMILLNIVFILTSLPSILNY